MSKPPPSFVNRVLGVMNSLPDAERRLAELALDNPGDLASYSASEFAALAGVSNATVSRFVRRLGFDDFNTARRSVRTEKNTGSPLLLDAKRRPAPDTVASHLAMSRANLEATMARLSDATIDEITQAIIAARVVWVAGYRSNQAFAAYFRWQIFQFLPKAQLLPGPGETIGEYMANFEASDCLVAFGVRRRARPLQHLITQAGRSKTKIVLVTDHLFGASSTVDWMVRCDAKAPGALDNHTAVIAFCDLLITRLFHATGKKGRQHLAAVEAAHDAADELSPL